MKSSSPNGETAMESFVWRTLCPSIDVLVDTAAIGHDAMDPEALHRFRVALRRLRCDLRSLRSFIGRPLAADLRERLAELDELVRPVRDGDVMVERLTITASKTSNPVDPEIIEAIHQALTAAADAARVQLMAELESGRFDVLIGELAALRDTPLATAPADADFPDRLDRLNKELWRRVRRTAKALADDADDAELHRLRVLAKRSRYLAEASECELGRSARRRARDAARIQFVLGEHQDSVVFSSKLLSMPHPTTAHTLAIDALLAVETEARWKLRKRWHKAWRRIERRWR